MTQAPKIVALAGSIRKASYNKLLVRIAAEGARSAGADVTFIDLADYPLPIFDEDLEAAEGMPENAARLKAHLVASDGILLAAPEYNSSITGALKNVIDWASRKTGDEPPLAAFSGKAAALMAASPGALGGLRGLVHVRSILSSIGVLVIPDQIAVPKAFEAFDTGGALRDPKLQARVQALGGSLAALLSKLAAE